MKALDAIRPGEILLKEFMEPNSISPQQIAASLGLPIDCMTDILQGSQSMTEEMAAELGLFFKMDPQFWRLNSYNSVSTGEQILVGGKPCVICHAV